MSTPEDNLQRVARRMGIPRLSDEELLRTFAAILEELRSRGISRTSNNPVGYEDAIIAETDRRL